MSDYAVYEGKIVPVNELMHHGIKGMKWGIRRYQNSDGSLTEAGRKRYYGYGTLDSEGMAKYSEHKKLNGEIVRQSVGKAALTGAALGAAVGGFAAGPAGAFLASAATTSIASMMASAAGTAAVNTGAAWINNKKYKKALIKEADEKRHAQEIRDNAQKKDNEFYKKAIDSEEKRAGRQLTDKEKVDVIKSSSKEGRGEEAAKKYLEQEKASNKAQIAMLTDEEAKKLGLDDSTKVTGKEASDFWKAYAAQIEEERRKKRR